MIVSGANLLLDEADVMAAESHIRGSKVLLSQLEISQDTTLAALKLAKQHDGILNLCLSPNNILGRLASAK